MHYHSTRSPEHLVDFRTALFEGLAPDGGLYMPEEIPHFSEEFLENLPRLTLPQVAHAVLEPYVGDALPNLEPLVRDAFNFPVPLTPLPDDTHLVELFHGPTLAFKDFAARFMARAMAALLPPDERLTVLVATSGDTGGAIAHAYLGLPNIDVKIFYPSGKVSPLQEKQLTTLGQNVTAYEVDGTFDDCQRLVKEAFQDPKLRATLSLTSANSINIARLLPQIVYHVYAYRSFMHAALKPIVVVPSGNFGNLTAGLIAQKMGLPVPHFIAANNRNDPVREFLETGKYRPRPSVTTPSNAMDVGDPSNFERLQWLCGDALSGNLTAYTVSDDDTRAQIRHTFHTTGVVLDPHTAVGVHAVHQHRATTNDPRPALVLSTAHPAKFLEIVEPEIGCPISLPEPLARLQALQKTSTPLVPNLNALRAELL